MQFLTFPHFFTSNKITLLCRSPEMADLTAGINLIRKKAKQKDKSRRIVKSPNRRIAELSNRRAPEQSECLEIDHLAAHAYVEHQTQRDHVGNDRAAPITDKGESDAGYGHHAHCHADVFKDLKAEHGEDPHYDQGAVEILGIVGDPHDSIQKNGVEADDDSASDQTQFLHDHREDEVRALNRQKF